MDTNADAVAQLEQFRREFCADARSRVGHFQHLCAHAHEVTRSEFCGAAENQRRFIEEYCGPQDCDFYREAVRNAQGGAAERWRQRMEDACGPQEACAFYAAEMPDSDAFASLCGRDACADYVEDFHEAQFWCNLPPPPPYELSASWAHERHCEAADRSRQAVAAHCSQFCSDIERCDEIFEEDAEKCYEAVCNALAAGASDPYQAEACTPDLPALSGRPDLAELPVTAPPVGPSGVSLLDRCTGMLSDQSAPERGECGQPLPIDETRVAQGGQSCKELEKNRANLYHEINRLNRLPPDEARNEMVRHLNTLRDWLEDVRSGRNAAGAEAVGGGAGTTASAVGLVACPETAGLGCLAALASFGLTSGFTGVAVEDIFDSNAKIDRLLRRIDHEKRRINDRSVWLQQPLNDALHRANMLCTVVQNQCM